MIRLISELTEPIPPIPDPPGLQVTWATLLPSPIAPFPRSVGQCYKKKEPEGQWNILMFNNQLWSVECSLKAAGWRTVDPKRSVPSVLYKLPTQNGCDTFPALGRPMKQLPSTD